MNTIRLSKFLSLVLRHNPGKIDLILDAQGWTSVTHLLERLAANGKSITQAQLEQVVETNDKQRFTFSDDGTKIRANQGHSINIDLNLPAITPPAILYHGTADRFLKTILKEGLNSRNRQHVHLSQDEQTAISVGTRHGKPIILKITSGKMHQEGHQFFQSKNDVWLTDHVPAIHLETLPQSKSHGTAL